MQGENADRLAAAVRRVELQQGGEEVPAELEEEVAQADRELFAGLRTMLGLDEAVSVNVGAAPTPREVLVFFHAIGIPLAELWGMSETCGAGCCNPPGRVKIGTVGPAGPGVELKLAEDGELLMRSGVVMTGYRNAPDKTAEALDADGWLHTGDIAQIDEDGYVRIVDRKKEIIINAAGKNMSPANIESALKGASPLIGQACVIGDGRPYNTALVVLDADFAPAFAAQQGIEGADLAALAQDERMRAAVQKGIDAANEKLARVEQIKKFHLVEGDWLPGGDEITPTMKLKRKPIAAKYDSQIAAMY
jgi:long-subunit acyl-CoA synthetase (AMP-forming)